DSWC
ncbi:hypothetical protein, conserved, partial [Babesia bigemina]